MNNLIILIEYTPFIIKHKGSNLVLILCFVCPFCVAEKQELCTYESLQLALPNITTLECSFCNICFKRQKKIVCDAFCFVSRKNQSTFLLCLYMSNQKAVYLDAEFFIDQRKTSFEGKKKKLQVLAYVHS
jgi:hypothetical protein